MPGLTGAGTIVRQISSDSLTNPLANVLKTDTGGWQTVFLVAAAMNFLVVLAAIFVLGPARRRAAAMRRAMA